MADARMYCQDPKKSKPLMQRIVDAYLVNHVERMFAGLSPTLVQPFRVRYSPTPLLCPPPHDRRV